MEMEKKLKSSCSRNPYEASDFPRDVLFDLLSRLPTKSLMRFKCVSKLWRSVISDPLFVKAHRSRSRTRSGGSGLLITFPDEDDSEQHFFLATHKGTSVFHQINLPFCEGREDAVTEVIDGLVCFHNDDDRVSICNITTHEIVSLPQSSFQGEKGVPHYFLGFEPINQEYKVLNVCTFSPVGDDGRRRRIGKCEILTLGRDSVWRRMDAAAAAAPPHILRDQSVCINGALHWVVDDDTAAVQRDDDQGGEARLLVLFDIEKEKFGVRSSQFSLKRDHHLLQLANGHLGLASTIQCLFDGDFELITFRDMWVGWRTPLPLAARRLHCCAAVGTLPSTDEVLLAPAKLSSSVLPVFACDFACQKWRRIEISEFPPHPAVVRATHQQRVRFRISYHVEHIISLRDLVAAQNCQ